ncbi:peptide deformylase [Candidatus Uhrbacteria bacterium]|nr:peptide deformylase [Candidatus Uhrbacteria bacterium]
MNLRAVLKNPNERLRRKAKKVSVEDIHSPEIQTLIDDLIETMQVENGVGIAATQIGSDKRVIIVDVNGVLPLINPEIVGKSLRKIEFEEGCLSVPGVTGIVKRHKEVKLKAYDRNGEPLTIHAKGLLAIVLQHETDHLDGILFIDKVIRYTNPPRM